MIKNMGQKVMARMLAALVIFMIAFFWNIDLIKQAYFTEQITSLGLVLNGIIFSLFAFGVIKLGIAFIHYSFEEKQLDDFIQGKSRNSFEIFDRISPKSIIYRRYYQVKELYDRKSSINHGALTSIMLAEESLYQSFPKFVNNILILSGVFGTIISLILALTGAGSVLKTSVSTEGVGMIIHGMNTALTTTATAIVAFFFFTYFYHKLTDVQTYLFGKIEETVLTYIVPEFAFDQETVNYQAEKLIGELTRLITEINSLTHGMSNSLEKINEQCGSLQSVGKTFSGLRHEQEEKSKLIIDSLGEINNTLKDTVAGSLTRISAQNDYQQEIFNTLLSNQKAQGERSEISIKMFGEIRDILKDGFRLR